MKQKIHSTIGSGHSFDFIVANVTTIDNLVWGVLLEWTTLRNWM